MWVLADVVGLFSINLGPLSRNVGRRDQIFSANVGPNRPMLSGRNVYVLRPLQLDVLYSQHKPAFFLSYATVAPIEAAGIYVPARRLPLNFGITAFPSQLQY
jgi:hypothetical protein